MGGMLLSLGIHVHDSGLQTFPSSKKHSLVVSQRGFRANGFYFLKFIYFVCMSVSSAYVSVQHKCIWFLQRAEGGTGSPGTGDMDGCEPPYGCYESNLGPLEECPGLMVFKVWRVRR